MKTATLRALLAIGVWPLLAIGTVGLTFRPPVAEAQQAFESYYLYLGNDNPDEAGIFWSEEAQGISHDADHWFITQNVHVWKIPVGDDLDADDPGPNVLHRSLGSYLPLVLEAYDHFGDLTHRGFDGTGYLFIAITGAGAPCPAVAVFRADTLSYVDHACVIDAPWAALDAGGFLYVGRMENEIAFVFRYSVDWDALRDAGQLNLSGETRIALFDGRGDPLQLDYAQGGVFSPDGDLLYMTTGMVGEDRHIHGIHVFDTSTWRRVQKSTNGSGHFNYEFDPTEALSDEEPEGITIWDLDDGRAPGIRGQLHVILLDNDWPSDDDVYLKNYTGTIHVDHAYTGPEVGTPAQPFNTVTGANNLAWDGARSRIRAGSYPETLTLSIRMKVVADGGTAVIGEMGRFP